MRDRLKRLLSLKSVLEHRPASCAQLARWHEVCERTIYRDLDYLRKLGVDLTFDSEAGGYRWNPRGLDLALGDEIRQVLRTAAAVLQPAHPHLASQLLTLSVSGGQTCDREP